MSPLNNVSTSPPPTPLIFISPGEVDDPVIEKRSAPRAGVNAQSDAEVVRVPIRR